MPLVSVIIPTYNRANYLPATLNSVLGQTFQDLEIIVVDDGSTDDTQEVLEPYRAQITYLHQPNQREGAARNHGIHHARGQFLAFLDSDDLWLPHKLQTDVAALERVQGAALVYSRVEYVSSTGERLGGRRLPTPQGDVLHYLVHENFISLSTVTVRREAFEAVGLFRTERELSGSFDWEAWVRLAAPYPFAHVPVVTTYVRIHEQNMLSNGAYMERAMLRAGDLMLGNPALRPRLAGQESRIRASLCLAIAINHCSNGDMGRARHFLGRAIRAQPLVACQPKLGLTFLKTLLGARLAFQVQRSRRRLAHSMARQKRMT